MLRRRSTPRAAGLGRAARLTLLLLGVLGLAGGLAGPGRLAGRAEPPPDPAFAPALWVAESAGLLKLRADTGAVLLEVAEAAGVRAVAVDWVRSLVWAYTPGALRGYTPDGVLARTVPVPAPPDSTDATPVALTVNLATGAVWLSVGTALRQVDATGALLTVQSLVEAPKALAYDPLTARLWVGTEHHVVALDDAGLQVAALTLAAAAVHDVAVDPTSGDLWVSLNNTLRRYDAATLAVEAGTRIPSLKRVAADGAGGAWQTTPRTLLRLDAAGRTLVSLDPWPGPGPLVAVAGDAGDQSVWVAAARGVSRVSPTGRILATTPLWAPLEVRGLALYVDRAPPTIAIVRPTEGAFLDTPAPTVEVAYGDVGSGIAPASLALEANGAPLAASCAPVEGGATCVPAAGFADGPVALAARVADRAGNLGESAPVTVTLDTVPPAVRLTVPAAGSLTNAPRQAVAGEVSEPATLTIRLNGTAVETLGALDGGAFTAGPVPLVEGANLVEVVALDRAGHTGAASATVTLDTVPPAAIAAARLTVGGPVGGEVTLTGEVGGVEAGARVTVTNLRTGAVVQVPAADDGTFTATIAARAGDRLLITQTDPAGNTSAPAEVEVPSGLPPDPATVAPPLDPTGVTSLADATAFLYTGEAPIQTGVAAGTIVRERAAVIRGRVLTRDAQPLPGVTITILRHPEYGQTTSRADGAFDLAVNGGGPLTVVYRRPGHLPAQRTIEVPWQDFVHVDDVVLVALDPAVTVVTAGAAEWQVHRAAPVTDADGTRRATLLVPPGTTAAMVLPDGTAQPLATLSVRATEYTVGPGGRHAMPAELPPTSGYTYAVELGVDEALAAGATSVQFSRPVVSYTENFLGFPTGQAVPVATYDRARAAWVPQPDGRVIRIVSVSGGLADLDVDPNSGADGGSALTALGITDAERARLATLYPVGQSLWRVPLTHFTPADFNYPLLLPGDAIPPNPDPPDNNPLVDEPCNRRRSIVECENQVLGERVAVTGTPFALHYRSDRLRGFRATRRLTIPLSGPSVPGSLKRIELRVEVAGRRLARTFDPPAADLTFEFDWNGRDAYGRPLQGTYPVKVAVSWVYPGRFGRPRCPAGSRCAYGSFGLSSPSGVTISSNFSRMEVTVTARWQTTLGGWQVPVDALGGWTLSAHHAYDLRGRVLHLGDGRRQLAQDVTRIIETVAGTGTAGFSGDGGPATAAQLRNPEGLALGPDGSLYLADRGNHVVRRLRPDGRITRVAGTGVAGSGGLGLPAGQAQLNGPRGLALAPDGSLYIADRGNARIVRVTPDGRLVRAMGGGTTELDGALASASRVEAPAGVAVAPDGAWYVAEPRDAFIDFIAHRLRRVGPDGRVVTVAGAQHSVFDCVLGSVTEALPALQATFCGPQGVALGPDGTLYIADQGRHRVRALGVDGRVRTAAGSAVVGYTGDGGPATAAALRHPEAVAIGQDGSLYVADRNHTVRWVSPDGRITTVAGTGFGAGSAGRYGGDGGPATAADLNFPMGLAVAPDGTLYIADSANHRIRRVRPPLPGLGAGEVLVPSEDGSELYRFDIAGRHLETRDALTGVRRCAFAYDSAGRLTAVTNEDGLVTTIERDGAGTATAIVAPTGERTALVMGPGGYLERVTNPAGEAVVLTYGREGLLTRFTNARGFTSTFIFDGLGRLQRDEDAAEGALVLARTREPRGYRVDAGTAEGRTTQYQVTALAAGGTQRRVTDPGGHVTTAMRRPTGTRTLTGADGTIVEIAEGADPRFGMQAPLRRRATVRTPGGLASTSSESRSVVLADPFDPLSLVSQTDTVRVNGRAYTTTWNAATRTVTSRTPAGRETVQTLDAKGRVVRVEAAGLAPVAFTYDARGRLETAAVGTGLEARVTAFHYDRLDRVTEVRDPLDRPTTFTYDPAGRVLTQTLPGGRAVGFTYDANGNVTSITPPSRPAHGFAYTPVDLEAGYTPPAVPGVPSPATTTAYNLDRQPTLVTRPDGQRLAFGYDAGGRLVRLEQQDAAGGVLRATTLGYAPGTGQLATVTAPDGGTLAYSYDGFLLTGVSWGSGPVTGSVSWTYDADFRVATETVGGTAPISVGYDADGLVTQVGDLGLTRDAQAGLVMGTSLGGVTEAFGYSTFGELATTEARVSGAVVYAVSYTRDALGRITERTETVGGETTVTGYRYDGAGRLEEVTRAGAVAATYAYDANGNRLSRMTPGGRETGTYDAQDRLLSYGAATYSYTANGELVTKTTPAGPTTYAYDLVGNLTRVALSDGRGIEYLHDGQHRRIGKRVNGVLVRGWLYRDALEPVAELDGSGQVVARFVYGANPLVPAYVVKGGVTYRLVADHLGSPRLVVDTSTGAVVQRLDYDEFGRVVRDTNPGFQPFGFAGGLYDPDTGLVRFGVRDYDPETGRWTSKDPLGFAGRDQNFYNYALADPISRIDPLGLKSYLLLATAVGGGLGPVGIEGGQLLAIDPLSNEVHIFRYFGGGPSVGLPFVNGAITIELGVICFGDANEISGPGWAVSGFAAAGKGGALQVSGVWSNDMPLRVVSAGLAAGVGASLSGLVTYTWYMGQYRLVDLPQDVREAVARARDSRNN